MRVLRWLVPVDEAVLADHRRLERLRVVAVAVTMRVLTLERLVPTCVPVLFGEVHPHRRDEARRCRPDEAAADPVAEREG